ncbi:MAG: DUF2207 domain-containing protein, partial [Actinomycetes bacterium]
MLRRGAVLLAVVAAILLAAAPATAADGERITSYDVVLTVERDGTLDVRESIAYDFGTNHRHGIFRTMPVRVPYDNDNDRVYRIDDFRVSSPSGAPTDLEESESGGVATYRIGHPDRTVTGRHVYELSYRVDGALNDFPTHVELYWNAVGADWDVPIGTARARVEAPGDIGAHTCFGGPTGSTLPCSDQRVLSPTS